MVGGAVAFGLISTTPTKSCQKMYKNKIFRCIISLLFASEVCQEDQNMHIDVKAIHHK